MTVPLRQFNLGRRINEVPIHDQHTWVPKHIAMLERSFSKAPHAREALDLASRVLSKPHSTIAQIARESMLALADYFELARSTRFVDSVDLGIQGTSSQRVFDVVKALGGTRYVTGHGAARYLDHRLFEDGGVEVAYMSYLRMPYPQGHRDFTPYVSALDLVAHRGPAGIDNILSNAVHWSAFLNESA